MRLQCSITATLAFRRELIAFSDILLLRLTCIVSSIPWTASVCELARRKDGDKPESCRQRLHRLDDFRDRLVYRESGTAMCVGSPTVSLGVRTMEAKVSVQSTNKERSR